MSRCYPDNTPIRVVTSSTQDWIADIPVSRSLLESSQQILLVTIECCELNQWLARLCSPPVSKCVDSIH